MIRLYQICDLGMCLYGANSPVAMPMKIFDYLAAGLPVINSVDGFLERLFGTRNLGMQYRAGRQCVPGRGLCTPWVRTSGALKRMVGNARVASGPSSTVRWQYGRFIHLLERL